MRRLLRLGWIEDFCVLRGSARHTRHASGRFSRSPTTWAWSSRYRIQGRIDLPGIVSQSAICLGFLLSSTKALKVLSMSCVSVYVYLRNQRKTELPAALICETISHGSHMIAYCRPFGTAYDTNIFDIEDGKEKVLVRLYVRGRISISEALCR